MSENPSHHVFVNRKVEGQGDLFSNSRTAPAVVPLLHFHNRMDEFCTRSLRAGLGTAIGGEQHAVLFLAHGLVKAYQGRRLEHNGRTEQASGTQPERQPAGKDPVRRGQIRRSLAGAIQDQELMLKQKRLGNKGTGAAGLHSITKGNCYGSSPYWTVLDSCCKCPIARNPMIALVAGGGFEPPTFGL